MSRNTAESPSSSGSRRSSTSGAVSRQSVASSRNSQQRATVSSGSSSCKSSGEGHESRALELVVTGRQLLRRSDRANSLPVYRRPSDPGLLKERRVDGSPKVKRATDSKWKKNTESCKEKKNESEMSSRSDLDSTKSTMVSLSSPSRETSMYDMSLELSEVSDFEETTPKTFQRQLIGAASTPKSTRFRHPRSGSLQTQPVKVDSKCEQSFDSYKQNTFSSQDSRDSLLWTASNGSGFTSVGAPTDVAVVSPFSQRSRSSSWNTGLSDVPPPPSLPADTPRGEWDTFWRNYNNDAAAPVATYYDQCPTPYRTGDLRMADMDFSTADMSRQRSPDDLDRINYIIRNEGLQLTPRETQSLVKCAHILGNVLTKAMDRNVNENITREREKNEKLHLEKQTNNADLEILKKNLKLELKPNAEEEETKDNAATQTDISLPNTKSAPKIFERILRQLSRSSIDDPSLDKKKEDKIEGNKVETVKGETAAIRITITDDEASKTKEKKEDLNKTV